MNVYHKAHSQTKRQARLVLALAPAPKAEVLDCEIDKLVEPQSVIRL